MIFDTLSNYQIQIIRKISSLANSLGLRVYLVGGCVRDFLLGEHCRDFDIAVEGNAGDLARIIHTNLGGRLVLYENFLSAKISLSSSLTLDFVSTRKEAYPFPGKLPQIKPGDIFADLQRRDFTINAIAISINNLDNEKILDPFNGIRDITKRTIRVLYDKSYSDDPTRILRAARYSSRLDFNIAENDKYLINFSKDCLNEISSARLKKEFVKICDEKTLFSTLEILSNLGALSYLLPGIRLEKLHQKHVDSLKSTVKIENNVEIWLIILLLVYWKSSQNIHCIYKVRFAFTKKEMVCLQWITENFYLIKNIIEKKKTLSFPEIHKLLFKAPAEIERLFFTLIGDKELSIDKLRQVRQGILIPLNGHDLIKQGLPSGPLIGKILSDLTQEVWEGKISTREEALLWLEKARKTYVK